MPADSDFSFYRPGACFDFKFDADLFGSEQNGQLLHTAYLNKFSGLNIP